MTGETLMRAQLIIFVSFENSGGEQAVFLNMHYKDNIQELATCCCCHPATPYDRQVRVAHLALALALHHGQGRGETFLPPVCTERCSVGLSQHPGVW